MVARQPIPMVATLTDVTAETKFSAVMRRNGLISSMPALSGNVEVAALMGMMQSHGKTITKSVNTTTATADQLIEISVVRRPPNLETVTGLDKILTDAYGDSSSSCNWGRTKVCCCNAPANEPYFLPVDLGDIFPTLPPVADNVKFDLQTDIKGSNPGSDPNKGAFGWVIIDGPASVVTSSKVKRDGSPSNLRFINCEDVKGSERQQVKFICLDNGPESDCDDMMAGGIAGTIIEMPDNCGLGKYAVAHEVADAKNQDLPSYFADIQNTTVKVLTIDYQFNLVRRDSSTEIFFRVDYSSVPGYWSSIVNSPASKRRSLNPRFYSDSAANWGAHFSSVFGGGGGGSIFTGDLTKTLFSGTLGCGGSQGAFAEILSSGSVSGTGRFGISMVGTISPDFAIQEVNSYLDTQIDVNLNLDFALYGKLQADFTSLPLFTDPITVNEFNHIGLVSIAPTLNMDVAITANVEIAANFSTGVHAFTKNNIVQTFPGAIMAATGQTDQQTVQNTFSGQVYDGSQGQIKVDFTPRMGIDVVLNQYGMSGTNLNAFVEGGFDTYNALSLQSDKTYSLSMGTSQATGELTYEDSLQEFPQWASDNDMTRNIGSQPGARVLASGAAGQGSPGGNGPPKSHSISNDSTAIFAQVNLLLCPNGLAEEITCNINLCNITSNYCNDDDSTADTTDDPLTKRAGPRTYTVNLSNGGVIVLSSRPYPSRGALFNGAAGAQVFNRALDYISPDLCDDFDVIDHDLTTIVLTDFVTEHLLELQTIGSFIEAANTGRLPSGALAQTPTIAATFFQTNWLSPVLPNGLPDVGSGISPNIPNTRIFEALGSNTNRADFVLAATQINAAKAHLWSFENPVDVQDFNDDVRNAIITGRDENIFLQHIRNVLAVFQYLQDVDVNQRLSHEISVVQQQMQIIEFNVAGAAGLTSMWGEFMPDYLNRVESYAQTWVTDRIAYVTQTYGAAAPAPANAAVVARILQVFQNAIADMRIPR
ncbi:hypothetical protein MMC11_008882 [Xylographa trunciseda]|nr:hypothetical protein [Xylographa trunciseda]